jgi:hypothetical protein
MTLIRCIDYVYIYLDYVIVDYAAPTAPHPIKAKFFFFQESIIYFRRTRHSGAPP